MYISEGKVPLVSDIQQIIIKSDSSIGGFHTAALRDKSLCAMALFT